MVLTPDQIKTHKFPLEVRGYERKEVDSFLERLANEYAHAVQRGGSNTERWESLGREIGSILEFAKESAERLREEAEQEARELRQKASDEAVKLREQASDDAGRLRREAAEEAATVRRQASDDAAEVREQAAREAALVQSKAKEQADAVVQDAQRRAEQLRSRVERECEETMRRASERQEALKLQERELRARAEAVDQTLKSLMSTLAPGAVEDREPSLIGGHDGSEAAGGVAAIDDGQSIAAGDAVKPAPPPPPSPSAT